jgi:hypothetical protein
MFLCSECRRPARPLCAEYRSHLVLQLPQMCRHHLSIHHGPSVGPLGPSCGEIARSARMASGRYRASQAPSHAREDVPTYFRDAGRPRGRAKAGRKLRSKIHARPVLAQNLRDGSWTGCKQEYAALGGSTLVAMVQTANFREGNDIAGRRRLYGTRPRAVLTKRKMRSGAVMVLKIAR